MFPSYKEIFDRRGRAYHQAMQTYPTARHAEFAQIIQLANLQDGQLICDVPSGGCYLSRFIQASVTLVSIETSGTFVQQLQAPEQTSLMFCEDLEALPLDSETCDRVICLAGVHHLPNQASFYREIYRILKPGGLFCLGDVREGSGVADFLNIFVHHYSLFGHQGIFLTPKTAEDLTAIGFQVDQAIVKAFPWTFPDVKAMVQFCQLLFGIDRATEAEILEHIEKYLGYSMTDHQCCLNWELFFWKAVK
jgi:SAM-dependent methyltransferase